MKSRLSNLCHFAEGRVAVSALNLDTYISTENMLPNKEGITRSAGLPTVPLTQAYQAGDVLVSNIRPYFRKIWFADRDGGCSNDILVLRAKEDVYPNFLYYLLSDEDFFDYATVTAKGTKMPRGDKGAIMQFKAPDLPLETQMAIAKTLSALDTQIENNKKINHHLEQQCSAIFRHLFVQGALPEWELGTIADLGEVVGGSTPSTAKPEYFAEHGIPWITPKDLSII